MPFTTIAPAPFREYAQRIFWPDIRTSFQVGTAVNVNGYTSSGISTTLWGAAVGPGSSTMQLQYNVPCARFQSTGAGGNREFYMTLSACYPVLTQANITPIAGGSPFQSAMRVHRISFMLRQANLPLRGGVGFLVSRLAPTAGIYWFGIEGDGAGGWRWGTNKIGGAGARVKTVAIPGLIGTDWNQFSLEMISAIPGQGDGQVRLFVNNVLFLTRSFGAGTVLPVYTDDAGNLSLRYVFGIFTNDGSVGSLIANAIIDIAGIELYYGRFTLDGIEIQGP
jgi:hypothetical protein